MEVVNPTDADVRFQLDTGPLEKLKKDNFQMEADLNLIKNLQEKIGLEEEGKFHLLI